MKTSTPVVIAALAISLASCSGGGTGGNEPAAAAASGKQKLTAKERMAKNNIIERHMNWKERNLQGKVKTLTKAEYFLLENGEKAFREKTVENYDASGNLIEYIRYTEDGKVESRGTLVFDSNGNNTSGIDYDADGKVTGMDSTRYDARGNQTEQYQYSEGKLEKKEIYQYDSSDNLITAIFYNPETNTVSEKWTYTYDANGFVTGSANYDADGRETRKLTRKTDEQGNELEMVFFEGGNAESKYENKYDSRGNVTEVIMSKPGKNESSKVTSEYDDKNNLTARTIYDTEGKRNDGVSQKRRLEYDQAGNVTKTTIIKTENGKDRNIELMETTYVYY